MPVYARTKLVIQDDCLPPPGSVSLSYTGPNPQDIYHQIKKLLKTIYKVEEAGIQEKEFRWDRTKAEETFSVKMDMVKDMDQFTSLHTLVELEGSSKPSREFGKEGKANIKIESFIRTEYPQDTLWQRSLLYEMFRVLYHQLIYKSTREKYLEDGKELVKHLLDELKSFLNILQRR